MPTVAVVGAGLIGRSWAVVFARAGFAVRLTDVHAPAREAAPGHVAEALRQLGLHGLVDDEAAVLGRVRVVATLAEAVAGADLVQENGPETVEAKRALFAELDALCPAATILASSTSAIVASRFTERLAGRARCLVGHPVNPPHLVPVVELCGAPWTDPAVVERARTLYAAAGQAPVIVRREVEGFVLNRLQGALLSEALRLVGEGVVSPEDLDRTVAEGLGLRWSFLGPFATIDLNAPGGVADYGARYGGFYRSLAADPAPPAVWDAETLARVVAAWDGGPDPAPAEERARRRDARLAALMAHKRAQP
ncbi:L-carnitine dehydrogenase [Methylobacterium crusticola]|uniref:L-carnitine dehydrogenase n=1 Tax=Methylobacterium crusticola TaxID=1697972 RepID=A0ABQ4R6K3_9HYPH|nr:3-hydroxyacyl-CoA dehydrogenase [Methylobacterium crusticola]GJD52429.1 L-carnitine dehydrogenase [Methylobacterium crusticola]